MFNIEKSNYPRQGELDTPTVDGQTPSLALEGQLGTMGASCIGRELMPNHKSAEKRMRQNEKRRVKNRGNRTKVRTYIKKLRSALESGKADEIQRTLPEAISVIDKSVQKGVLHANAAARYKSRLTVRANQAGK